MKLILLSIIALMSPVLVWSQSTVTLTDAGPDTKTRLDTIKGAIIFVYEAEGTIHINTGEKPFYNVVGLDGIRVDTIVSHYGEVPCPDEKEGTYFGCAALHYGWTDTRKGSAFYIDKMSIDRKRVIHFINQ